MVAPDHFRHPADGPPGLQESHATPYIPIFYVQLLCFQYFAPQMPPILMKTKIGGRGEGGAPISPPIMLA